MNRTCLLLLFISLSALVGACGSSGSEVVGADAGDVTAETAGEVEADLPGDTGSEAVDDAAAPESSTCKDICLAAEAQCGMVDGCDCGTCAEGETCDDKFKCVPAQACDDVCGPPACGVVDGCDCGTDCGPEMTCDLDALICVPVENPECEKICADDNIGCGEYGECWCGDCEDGFSCVDGSCVDDTDPCVAACAGKACGKSEDCECGTCADDEKCQANQCVTQDPCVAACAAAGAECGPVDTCQCGACTFGECLAGQCVCEPQCEGKACGPDGCGGDCGTCAGSMICAWNSQCYASCDPNLIGFSKVAQKIITLAVGASGMKGQALDVDNDPTTCAPAGDCEAGLDNNLAALFSQLSGFVDVNAQMQGSVEDGSLVMLMEFPKIDVTGKPFTLNMFMGEPKLPKAQCDFQAKTCEYLVLPDSIDGEACKPVFWFDNATLVDGFLHAGGAGYVFTMVLSLLPTIPLKVSLFNAQVVGTVIGEPGASMTISGGIIGGAIPKDKLLAAIDAIPAGVELPISKDMLKNLLNIFIVNDIDTDGDGQMDSASVAMLFTSFAGIIAGVAQ